MSENVVNYNVLIMQSGIFILLIYLQFDLGLVII